MSNVYYVAWGIRTIMRGDELDAACDAIAKQLPDFPSRSIEDLDLTVTLTTGEVGFTGYVRAKSLNDALDRFTGPARGLLLGWPVWEADRIHVHREYERDG
jgi:hypothetical protein